MRARCWWLSPTPCACCGGHLSTRAPGMQMSAKTTTLTCPGGAGKKRLRARRHARFVQHDGETQPAPGWPCAAAGSCLAVHNAKPRRQNPVAGFPGLGAGGHCSYCRRNGQMPNVGHGHPFPGRVALRSIAVQFHPESFFFRHAELHRNLPEFFWPTHVLILTKKSTRLNSSHVAISYAVFCLKKI